MNKTTLLDQSQLLDIFSSSYIATAIYSSEDLIIEAVTDAMLVFLGKTRAILGLPLAVAVPELLGQPFIEQMRATIQTGETFIGRNAGADLEIDGKLQTSYYDYEYRPLKDASGAVFAMIHTATDVTESVLGRQAIENEQTHLQNLETEQALNEELTAANEELLAMNDELAQTRNSLEQLNVELESRVAERTEKLAASEANLSYLIDDAPVAIAVLMGANFLVERANQYILKIWGKSETIIGKSIYQALPEIKGQGFFELLEKVYQSGEAFHGNEVPGKMNYNGTLLDIYTNFVFKPLKSDDGSTYGVMIVASEVTEQVNAKLVTEALKLRFQSMVNTTPVAMTILTGHELIVEQVNQPMLTVWRRSREQVMGKGLLEIFPELVNQPNPARMRKVMQTGERLALAETPVTLVDAQGVSHTHYAKFSYDPIFDQDQISRSLLVTVMDITELVHSRQELEQQQLQLHDTSEELAASNEELGAINEEMAASNEELIAINEELRDTQDDLRTMITEVEMSRERFSFLLNTMPQQVWTAKPDGSLDYVNQVVSKDFGYDMDAIVGYGWQQFIHPEDLPQAMEHWLQALGSGKEYLVEFRLRLKDNCYHWHLARAVPMIENGEIQFWLGTNTNIELQKSNERKKDEFLSIASHELKTPLTSIKAFNQLMARSADPERLSSFIKKSSEHIQKLEKLISDLLDVTKMNAGKLEYNMDPFNLGHLLADSIENIQYMALNHELIIRNNIQLDFIGDQFRLEQVMNNLLSNAIKYSPMGKSVIVNSKIEEDRIVISVQDFGIGIDPSHINKLFDRFYRVDHTAMRFEGLGLGLFISGEIIKRHQGSIWVESELGKGSTFYVSLPLTPSLNIEPTLQKDLDHTAEMTELLE